MTEYKEAAKQILDEFSKALEGIPEHSETSYGTELTNVLRSDGQPQPKTYSSRIIGLAPRKDSKGNVLAERIKL